MGRDACRVRGAQRTGPHAGCGRCGPRRSPDWSGDGRARPPSRSTPDQAVSRARPFLRRACTMARPARVRMRIRKPCLRARRRLLGWNVRFTEEPSREKQGTHGESRRTLRCQPVRRATEVPGIECTDHAERRSNPPAPTSLRPVCATPGFAPDCQDRCGTLLAFRPSGGPLCADGAGTVRCEDKGGVRIDSAATGRLASRRAVRLLKRSWGTTVRVRTGRLALEEAGYVR